MKFDHKNKAVKGLGIALTSAGLLATSVGALAAGSADVLMEEVMVYGTKKSAAESVQDIAGVVTAFGSAQLEAKQVINLEDLSFSTPNVFLDSIGTQRANASFSIRGLGIDNSTPSIDPNVGVFIDGVYAGVGYGIVADTFDLESIEIYKGPQGLLFGRNVTGGAVLLRSKRPTGEFNFKAKIGAEEGEQYLGAFAVEGSLIEDVLAARVSVQYRDKGGYFENEFLHERVGAEKSELFKAAFVYTPTDDLELTLLIEDGNLEADGTPVQFHYDEDRIGTISSENPFIPSASSFDIRHDFVGIGNTEWTQFTFETVYQIGNGVITNIMAYREVDSHSTADVDGAALSTPINTEYIVDQHQFTEEIRYNLAATDDWDLTVGLSYFAQEYEYANGLTVASIDTAQNLIDGAVNDRFGGGLQDQSSISFYINNELRLTDTFALVGGVNFSKEKKSVVIIPRDVASLKIDPDAADLPPICNHLSKNCDWSRGSAANEDWTNLSPKFGFTWQLLDEAQFYGHWARAYRSGFYNLRTPTPDAAVPTDVEEHNAYELGIKSVLLDGSLRFNAAVFYQDIEDLARSAGRSIGDIPVQDLINVGDATISGFEFDVMARLGDNLILTLAVGYLDGDITDPTVDLNKDGLIDSGDKKLAITRLSEWTTSFSVTYDLQMGNYGVWSLRADHGYRAEAANRDDNFVFTPQTTIVNAGATFTPNVGNWSLSMYVKNLTDEIHYAGLFPLSDGKTMFAPVKEGRRYGIEMRYEL
ncbi:MAG: TonB-dependent receptor [Pseudomonadales bacterium]|nr:TonB-dependent receptor [Pseudomonadales bacterium]